MLSSSSSTSSLTSGRFQINIDGTWRDYGVDEDRILKKYHSRGEEKVVIHLRGRGYAFNFRLMQERNLKSGKVRSIRPPVPSQQEGPEGGQQQVGETPAALVSP